MKIKVHLHLSALRDEIRTNIEKNPIRYLKLRKNQILINICTLNW